jgi:glycosyltransferase involved in cell wall biosynthesis
MRVIITIPAYNEERTIGKVLNEIKQVMNKTKYNYKLLVIDDGSHDKTPKIAKKYGAIVYSNKENLGLIKTFKTEMKKCLDLGADIIVHTDADGQYLAKDIPKLIKKIEEGYDIVIGSRFKFKNKNLSFLKNIGNKAFALVFSNIMNKKITDTTSGFRAFTKEIAKNIELINNFTYTQEQLIRVYKMNYKIGEIGVKTRKTRKSRLFKHPLQYAFKAWINILRIYRDYNPLSFFGRIGLFLFLIGILIGLYFLKLHFTIGIKGHLGLSFLMLILLFSGIQIMLFGFLADMKKQ